MKRALPKVSRRRIGSKPRSGDILSAAHAHAIHELMLEEDRQWTELVARKFSELSVPKSFLAQKPEKTVSGIRMMVERHAIPRMAWEDKLPAVGIRGRIGKDGALEVDSTSLVMGSPE